MKKILLSLCLMQSVFFLGQSENYAKYHTSINKAEELFFVEEKVDSALFYYDTVFEEYDFIFVKDILNAAQIAVHTKKPFQKYIEKGFLYGLKIDHLKRYPLLKKFYDEKKEDKKLNALYKKYRKKYLKKIDFKYLDFIYKIAIRSQLKKTLRESIYKFRKDVRTKIKQILDSIPTRGFPGDRVIGISDSTIFKEINKPHLDLYRQVKKHEDLWYMKSNEKSMSESAAIVLFINNPCSYFMYKDMLKSEMLKGNIHPRDIAMFYDMLFGYNRERPYCSGFKDYQAYYIDQYATYPKKMNMKLVSKMRKELYLVPKYVDDKKKIYEQKHQFKIFSGYSSNR